MPPRRDLAAFEDRAAKYDSGWLGKMHHEIADRTATIALQAVPSPQRILDVGCGTGYLLRELAERAPEAIALAGIDPAPAMIDTASKLPHDARLTFLSGVGAENLPYLDETFDLVVSSTSFDHWSDQCAGLRECARVMRSGGQLVLVDQFSAWLLPTLLAGRRGKARTKRRATRRLVAAGFTTTRWQDVYAGIIKAVIAAE